MKQGSLLVDTLKRLLKSRGLTYRELAKRLKLSEPSVKRIFARKTFTLDRLDDVCTALEMDLFEVVRLSRPESYDQSPTFSTAQEQALAREPKLFAYFYLLLTGLKPSEITARYRFGETESHNALARLESLSLIKRDARGHLRLLVTNNVRWNEGGPLNRLYAGQIKQDFLDSRFAGEHERFRLLTAQLSEAAIKRLSQRIDKLIGEFLDSSEVDAGLARSESKRVWMLVAYRPWLFSVVARLRR